MSTSIAIIRTGQCVVIAADSAVVDELGNRIGLQCKIRQIGNFVYVANKFTLDSASNYNLSEIVANVSGRESLGALAAALKEAIPGPLVRALAGSRQRNPGRFQENFRTAQVLGVTVAGVENGRPSLVDFRFRMNDMEAEEIHLTIEEHRCPGAGCPTGLATILVGPPYLQERFENVCPKFWIGIPEELARNAEAFVQMAIDAGLADAAPPISVLVIKPNGFEWRKSKTHDD
jgi:hypothetical protein